MVISYLFRYDHMTENLEPYNYEEEKKKRGLKLINYSLVWDFKEGILWIRLNSCGFK